MRRKGKSKHTPGDSFGPFGVENKDLGAASQTLLTKVRLRLQRRLLFIWVNLNSVAVVVVNWFLLTSVSDIIVIQLHVAKISLQNTGIECITKLKNAYSTLGWQRRVNAHYLSIDS